MGNKASCLSRNEEDRPPPAPRAVPHNPFHEIEQPVNISIPRRYRPAEAPKSGRNPGEMANHNNQPAIVVISDDSDSDLDLDPDTDSDNEPGPARRQGPFTPSPAPAGAHVPGQLAFGERLPAGVNGFGQLPVRENISNGEMAAPGRDLVIDDLMREGFYNLDGDFFDGVPDVDEQRAMMEDINRANAARNSHDQAANPLIYAEPPKMPTKEESIEAIADFFPDICRIFVSDLYDTVSQQQEFIVTHILDLASYPKAKDIQMTLKRKRGVDLDEETARKYAAPGREVGPRQLIRDILAKEFIDVPMVFIDACLVQSAGALFPAYRILEEAQRTFDPRRPVYKKLLKSRKNNDEYGDNVHESRSVLSSRLQEDEVLQELQAARRIRRKADAKRDEERQKEEAEAKNIAKAIAEGNMLECGCCFDEYPINRMVHCNNGKEFHWFCRNCARQNAETEIGESRYVLKCMSMDSCEDGFSLEQRALFLDDKTVIALERIHQESELRMAGIENLASCPFCTYAAEYPPIDEDREFRCQKPDCEKISCRLCNLESHIPKSCEENAKDNGLSVRRQIEEAMSDALIRRCNKCNTPFIKIEGCNKMMCTQSGCGNIQCYICSKSCGYDHFNDARRGGKTGNCPLFDEAGVESRHINEVEKAKHAARAKVMEEHPEYTEEDLEIKLSAKALADEGHRKQNGIRQFGPVVGLPVMRGMRRQFIQADRREMEQLAEEYRRRGGGENNYNLPPVGNFQVPRVDPRKDGGAFPPDRRLIPHPQHLAAAGLDQDFNDDFVAMEDVFLPAPNTQYPPAPDNESVPIREQMASAAVVRQRQELINIASLDVVIEQHAEIPLQRVSLEKMRRPPQPALPQMNLLERPPARAHPPPPRRPRLHNHPDPPVQVRPIVRHSPADRPPGQVLLDRGARVGQAREEGAPLLGLLREAEGLLERQDEHLRRIEARYKQQEIDPEARLQQLDAEFEQQEDAILGFDFDAFLNAAQRE